MRISHFLFLLTAIFVALLLAGCQAGPQVILPSPTPTEALLPTATSTPEATPTPTPAPIPADAMQVNLYCPEGNCEVQVSTGDFVVVTWFWAAKTPELVQSFLNTVSYEVTVNGEAILDPTQYMGEVEEFEGEDGDNDYDDDGENDFSAVWLYPIGPLAPGTHTFTLTLDFSTTITDGFDLNNDGRTDEYGPETQVHTVRVVAS